MSKIKTHEEPFSLIYGLEYGGERHFDGTIRVPTALDRETALEEVQDNASEARVARHVWARTIQRLGTIPRNKITPELLANLVDDDYGPIHKAEENARKKLLPVKGAPKE